MTQPTERRFVMEPRLDAEIETINDALDLKVDLTDPRLTDERTPLDNSVTSAKIVDGTIVKGDIADGTISSAKLDEQEYIKFDTTYTGGSTQPGEVAWNADQETLEFQLDPHVTLQIGQEHVMRIKNNSGSVAIPNGTVVMFAGATGDTITVAPAVSDGTINVNYLAGITTEEIPADGFGFVTQLGFINGVNTNAYTVGTILYVDPATPGGLTATEPESPAWTMPVAAVTKQNASSGRLLVRAIPGGSGAGGGASVNVSDTAPAGGNEGDLWLDSTDGTLYVYYEDVDGAQWIQVQANSALGASIESRLGALESQAIALGTYSPNYVINGAFEINQRGFTSTTGSGFTFDRWSVASASGTVTYSSQVFSPGSSPSATVTGKNYLRCVTSGQSGSSAYAIFGQSIEGVETLAGQVVTVSFWAKAASGTPKVALEMYRSYGAGGSPSGDEALYAGQVTISTTLQRYSITYTLPSIAGKVLGTSHTGYVKPQFWLSAGTDFNSRTGSIGIQSNTFDIWGVQVESGSTATAFRRNANSLQGELSACQRYYYKSYAQNVYANGASIVTGNVTGVAADTSSPILGARFAVPMRATPSVQFFHPPGGAGNGSMRDNVGGGAVTGMAVGAVNEVGLGYVFKIGSMVAGRSYSCEIVAEAEL